MHIRGTRTQRLPIDQRTLGELRRRIGRAREYDGAAVRLANSGGEQLRAVAGNGAPRSDTTSGVFLA
jgi:hypothetical protein